MSFISDLIESYKYASSITSIQQEKSRVNHAVVELILLRGRYSKGLSPEGKSSLQKAINYSQEAKKEIDEILDGAESAVERGEI